MPRNEPDEQRQSKSDDVPPTPEELGLSRDATHSAYAPISEDRKAENPPPGQQVEQTLGKPKEASD
jgi:hypothetical protein